MLALAVAPAIIAVLLVARPPIVLDLWPFPGTSNLAFVFLASILAAAAASTAWAALAGERVSYAGIGLDIMVIFWPMAIYLLTVPAARGGGLTILFAVIVAMAVLGTVLVARTVRAPMTDPRPTPRLVRVAFLVFTVALVFVGGALVTGRPNTVPWSVTPEVSVICGLIFLGAAAYFVFALVRPGWSNAGGQLAGFLAYDLVLIPPLAGMLGTVPGYWRGSLWAYLVVLVVSGVVAAWYLFLDPRTRPGSRRPTA